MRTHVEEEIYILGPTLLERARGLLRNRRDARDEESLREPATTRKKAVSGAPVLAINGAL